MQCVAVRTPKDATAGSVFDLLLDGMLDGDDGDDDDENDGGDDAGGANSVRVGYATPFTVRCDRPSLDEARQLAAVQVAALSPHFSAAWLVQLQAKRHEVSLGEAAVVALARAGRDGDGPVVGGLEAARVHPSEAAGLADAPPPDSAADGPGAFAGGVAFLDALEAVPGGDEGGDPVVWYVSNMAVAPEWRGRGVGRALLRALAVAARAQGIPALFLHVEPGNAAARALYASLGFSPHGLGDADAGDVWSEGSGGAAEASTTPATTRTPEAAAAAGSAFDSDLEAALAAAFDSDPGLAAAAPAAQSRREVLLSLPITQLDLELPAYS